MICSLCSVETDLTSKIKCRLGVELGDFCSNCRAPMEIAIASAWEREDIFSNARLRIARGEFAPNRLPRVFYYNYSNVLSNEIFVVFWGGFGLRIFLDTMTYGNIILTKADTKGLLPINRQEAKRIIGKKLFKAIPVVSDIFSLFDKKLIINSSEKV